MYLCRSESLASYLMHLICLQHYLLVGLISYDHISFYTCISVYIMYMREKSDT